MGELEITCEKSVNSARPLVMVYQTGCCMNAFAIKIHITKIFDPMATSHIVAACIPLESLSHPKIHTPKNVDSRKKASKASRARGAPKISPTKREYSDHVMPNWNSWTMPVTTPIAKLIRSNLPQN